MKGQIEISPFFEEVYRLTYMLYYGCETISIRNLNDKDNNNLKKKDPIHFCNVKECYSYIKLDSACKRLISNYIKKAKSLTPSLAFMLAVELACKEKNHLCPNIRELDFIQYIYPVINAVLDRDDKEFDSKYPELCLLKKAYLENNMDFLSFKNPIEISYPLNQGGLDNFKVKFTSEDLKIKNLFRVIGGLYTAIPDLKVSLISQGSINPRFKSDNFLGLFMHSFSQIMGLLNKVLLLSPDIYQVELSRCVYIIQYLNLHKNDVFPNPTTWRIFNSQIAYIISLGCDSLKLVDANFNKLLKNGLTLHASIIIGVPESIISYSLNNVLELLYKFNYNYLSEFVQLFLLKIPNQLLLKEILIKCLKHLGNIWKRGKLQMSISSHAGKLLSFLKCTRAYLGTEFDELIEGHAFTPEDFGVNYEKILKCSIIRDRFSSSHFLFDNGFIFNHATRITLFRLFCVHNITSSFFSKYLCNKTFKMDNLFPMLAGVFDLKLTNPMNISRESLMKSITDGLGVSLIQGTLKSPIITHFDNGEIAQDFGGVQLEMFNEVAKNIMDPQYGMFNIDDESQMAWFNPSTAENPIKYQMIGALMAIAVNNGCIIPVNFPLILYSFLIGDDISSLSDPEDIKDLFPALYRSFKALLEFQGDACKDMSLEYAAFIQNLEGKNIAIPLGNSNEDMVTNENKKCFVKDYITFIIWNSVYKNVIEFKAGWRRFFPQSVLSLLNPQQLKDLTEGVQISIPISNLKKQVVYHDSYSESHPSIIHFWEALESFSPSQLQSFLYFVTSCARPPINGLKFSILPMQLGHSQHDYLPVAHTCTRILSLPPYDSIDLMKSRLLKAIEWSSEGFGLL